MQNKSNIEDKTVTLQDEGIRAAPRLHQTAREIQKYGTRFRVPLGLSDEACEGSITDLNKILADTMTIRDLYKKSHWQTSGVTFYQLHLLFEKHYGEQAELVDELAERIQVLGGISVAMASDVAELSEIPTPPKGREEVPVQLSRLIEAHEVLFKTVRIAAKKASDNGDDGTNDLLVSNVIRTNELQMWFLVEHLVSLSATIADNDSSTPERQ